ncbi:MAG TPA: pseudouridine synthase [bacterium]|nr:pseudouridine synthase [bacterium]HPW39102.1 pseudouridine synthase [bacterium]
MIRLQKFLAEAGIASRRKCEQLITAGKIKVNGQIISELGYKIDEHQDRVEYRGKPVKPASGKIYLAINKPPGYICSASTSQGKSVLELVDIKERIYSVGRLDKDSTGLLLLTNDGEFANKISHPRHGAEKEYLVLLDKKFQPADSLKLAAGMMLDGKKLQPIKTAAINGLKIKLILHEGVNREIRRLLGRLGYRVINLTRIRIGRLSLGRLKTGQWKKITPEQI